MQAAYNAELQKTQLTQRMNDVSTKEAMLQQELARKQEEILQQQAALQEENHRLKVNLTEEQDARTVMQQSMLAKDIEGTVPPPVASLDVSGHTGTRPDTVMDSLLSGAKRKAKDAALSPKPEAPGDSLLAQDGPTSASAVSSLLFKKGEALGSAEVVCTSAGELKEVPAFTPVEAPSATTVPRPLFDRFSLSLSQGATETISLTQDDAPAPASKKAAMSEKSAGPMLEGACRDGRFRDAESLEFQRGPLEVGRFTDGVFTINPGIRRNVSPAPKTRVTSAARPRKSRTDARSREASITPTAARRAAATAETEGPPLGAAAETTDVPREDAPAAGAAGGDGGQQPQQQQPQQGEDPLMEEKRRMMKLLAAKQEEFTRLIPLAGPSRQLQMLANCPLVHLPQRYLGRTAWNKPDAELTTMADDDVQEFGLQQDMEVLENTVDVLESVMKLYRRCNSPAARTAAMLRTWNVHWQDRFRALPMTVMLALQISRAAKHKPNSFFAFSQDRLGSPYELDMQPELPPITDEEDLLCGHPR